MQVTLMVSSGDPEIIWNGFRMANLMLEEMDEVTVFLNGPSVRYAALASAAFPLAELAKLFTLSEGVLLACGRVLDLHGVENGYHQRASQKDLYQLIAASDRLLSY